MGDIFLKLLNTSITAVWIILAVLCVRLIFRKIPKWANCLLWAIVAFRLACPFSIESPFSLQPSAEPIKTVTTTQGEITDYIPSIDSRLPVVENSINPLLLESFSYEESNSVSPFQVTTYIAGIIWLGGVILLLIFAALSVVKLHRLVREAVPIRNNIYICDAVKSPFILGIIRPRIYLPSATGGQTENYVIAHEAAHLKRKDHWWKAFGYLLLCVYWFNPFCWAAYIMFCRDIELACDEKAAKNMTLNEKKEYSKVLLSCTGQKKLVMVCPLAFGEVGVKIRVKSILNYKKPTLWIIIAAAVVCLILAFGFLTNPTKEYRIKITIPAGSTEPICYSDEEISPKGGTLTFYAGEGMEDTEIKLLPIEALEENAYDETVYLTRGMPAKMVVEKGAWFKVGVNIQNPTEEDRVVYLSVRNVTVRISSLENGLDSSDDLESKSSEEKTKPESHAENSDSEILTKPPLMQIVYEDMICEVASGNWQWSKKNADGTATTSSASGAHPLENSYDDFGTYIFVEQSRELHPVELRFEVMPDSIEVINFWPSSKLWFLEGNETGLEYNVTVDFKDYNWIAVRDDDSYIYEIRAIWNQEEYQGEATYSFQTRLRSLTIDKAVAAIPSEDIYEFRLTDGSTGEKKSYTQLDSNNGYRYLLKYYENLSFVDDDSLSDRIGYSYYMQICDADGNVLQSVIAFKDAVQIDGKIYSCWDDSSTKLMLYMDLLFHPGDLGNAEERIHPIDELRPVEENETNGTDGIEVSMDFSRLDADGGTLVITNTSDKDLDFGEDYKLYVWKEETWQEYTVKEDKDYGFKEVAFMLDAGKTVEWDVNWSIMHGSLPEGRYKIEKSIDEMLEPGNFNRYNVSCQFEIG